MHRILQWVWDRYTTTYSWAWLVIAYVAVLPVYLFLSFAVVASEGSTRYLHAAMAAAIAVLMVAYAVILPGRGVWKSVQQWAAGKDVDRADVLEATYTFSRRTVGRSLTLIATGAAVLLTIVGDTAGADGARLVQYTLVGAVVGFFSHLTGVHTLAEAPMRPVRAALCADSAIGDSLPRSRPAFATWTNLAMLAAVMSFAVSGSIATSVFGRTEAEPLLCVLVGFALTLIFGIPITVGAAFSPSLQPIADLAAGTERVAAGDFSRRLPVVQDDDLGALAASFNRMQAGLTERQRLAAAFGTYVDPILARRLLEQGDDVFTGERREVSVMFVDIRDFTPFAEANPAEDVVSRLNALFEIVVPTVVHAGGHVNKFLGDGALAVFGAPNDLADHADAAVNVAVAIQHRVARRFGAAVRIGIGINTGEVIAGTIGAAGKLEFTLIGDAVNVAARVEQLTKTTGDTVLLTQNTVDALTARPGLVDRGTHALKGKSADVRIFGLASEAFTGE